MIYALSIVMLLCSASSDPVAVSRQHFEAIQSYRATIVTISSSTEEVLHYYFKKPGFVRIESELPYPGTVITYDPDKEEVRVRPFAFLPRFVLTLNAANRILRSATGHRVDESDLGALIQDVMQLQENGQTIVQGEEPLLGYNTRRVEVRGREKLSTHYGVHVYVLWIDEASCLPVKVRAYDANNELIEDVMIRDLKVDVGFDHGFFEQ